MMGSKDQTETVTAEEIGLHSGDVQAFLDEIEENHVSLHSFLIARNGKIGAEGYWKPFAAQRPHRMYSVTKSFVSIAVGILADEGRLSLQDKIVSFFPELLPQKVPPYLEETTVEQLLMMATPYSRPTYDIGIENWLESYFQGTPDHPAGTIYTYDSCGSYVLGALVRRITGQDFLSFLKDKVLLKIGFDPDRYCLLGPDGELWSGSGLIITTRELASFAELLVRGGEYNGEQLISREYVRRATSPLICNTSDGSDYSYHCGYGYQIWCGKDRSFFFNGMGGQFAFGFPDTGLVFACTADVQPNPAGKHQIYDALWRHIVEKLQQPMEPDAWASRKLQLRCASLELQPYAGEAYSSIEKAIRNAEYRLDENAMGIRWVRLSFSEDGGVLQYENERGRKELRFGRKKYAEGFFPEEHYPGRQLKKPANRRYECASAASWVSEQTLVIKTVITDDYIGSLTMTFTFRGDRIGIRMVKHAQFFLDEYQGYAGGNRVR